MIIQGGKDYHRLNSESRAECYKGSVAPDKLFALLRTGAHQNIVQQTLHNGGSIVQVPNFLNSAFQMPVLCKHDTFL